MDLQKCLRLFGDGVLIVCQVGLVGGSHLHQRCAALFHHIGHAELSADLHQLAAGYHNLAALCHRV